MRSTPLRKWALARAERFVAGETISEALSTTRELVGQGFAVSIDRFGERLDDLDAIAGIVDEYQHLGRAVAGIEGDVYLEVVPSHLGIDVSVDFFCEQARGVADGLPSDARLEISAEESQRTARIIDASLRLAGDGVPVVATVQANLRRSESDARMLVDAGVPAGSSRGPTSNRPRSPTRGGNRSTSRSSVSPTSWRSGAAT